MKNIKVIQQDIDISTLLLEIGADSISSMWTSYGNVFEAFKQTQTIRIIGPSESVGVKNTENTLRNSSEVCVLHADVFPQILKWLRSNFPNVQRAALIKLFPSQKVLKHVDRGEWFEKVQRYHLCLAGQYRYDVGDECIVVTPGTLFTFNNNVEHGALNLKDEDRITLMFDVGRN